MIAERFSWRIALQTFRDRAPFHITPRPFTSARHTIVFLTLADPTSGGCSRNNFRNLTLPSGDLSIRAGRCLWRYCHSSHAELNGGIMKIRRDIVIAGLLGLFLAVTAH